MVHYLTLQKYELELFGEEKNNGSISYGALEKVYRWNSFN